MATPPDAAPPEELSRVRVHTSLIERPLFMGVDMEILIVSAFLVWTTFMLAGFTLTLGVVALLCVGMIGLMKRANAKDPFFLPILIRSLSFRRLYASRQGPTEIESVRPSLPKRALHA